MATTQGPRETMEDVSYVVENGPCGYMFATVLDGHAGIASAAYLEEHLFDSVKSVLTEYSVELTSVLTDSYRKADEKLLSWLTQQPDPERGSGCTATTVLVNKERIIVANVGDSRAVMSRTNGPIDLSTEHRVYGTGEVVAAESQRVEESGGWVEDGRVCGVLLYLGLSGTPISKEKDSKTFPDHAIHEQSSDQKNGVPPTVGVENSNGLLAVHGGELSGRPRVSDSLTTPIVQTATYTFTNTQELIDYQEGRYGSYEYGRYGNPTVKTLEDKIKAMELAEDCLVSSSGMNSATTMLLALVPAGGHIVTTTDCYRRTRQFIQTFLPKMGITATVIDPSDLGALERALDEHNVALFFSESPTNPYLRCVDIPKIKALCEPKGAAVVIDSRLRLQLINRLLLWELIL
eukprot:jgi/Picre1/35629/NNA_003090.t1